MDVDVTDATVYLRAIIPSEASIYFLQINKTTDPLRIAK